MTDLKKEQTTREKKENLTIPETGAVTPEKPETRPAETEKISEPGPEPVEQPQKPFPHRPVAHVLPVVQDPFTRKIEKILEENVGDAYSRLSPIAKEEFKLKGEVTAQKISELMKQAHVKVKKVFQLILEWLKMLPGINRFFLEQEAKIKTDRIIALHKRQ